MGVIICTGRIGKCVKGEHIRRSGGEVVRI